MWWWGFRHWDNIIHCLKKNHHKRQKQRSESPWYYRASQTVCWGMTMCLRKVTEICQDIDVLSSWESWPRSCVAAAAVPAALVYVNSISSKPVCCSYLCVPWQYLGSISICNNQCFLKGSKAHTRLISRLDAASLYLFPVQSFQQNIASFILFSRFDLSLIQWTYIEHLLWTRPCSRHWLWLWP